MLSSKRFPLPRGGVMAVYSGAPLIRSGERDVHVVPSFSVRISLTSGRAGILVAPTQVSRKS